MTQRTAARLAWTIWGLAVLLAGGAMVVIALGQAPIRVVEAALYVAIFMAMGAVGALVIGRQPRNAVGWILVAISVAAALAFGGDAYARHATFADPGSLPGAAWAWWLSDSTWVWILSLPSTFLLLLFPDGRVPSRRWRPFLWGLVAFVSLAFVAFTLGPARYPGGSSNPIQIEALGPLSRLIEGPGYALLLACAVVSAMSLIVRYRRADRQQRLQIKWFGYAVSLLLAYFLVDGLLTILAVPLPRWLTTVFPVVAFASIPVGLGIAILRHRLYDIDVVINRTVLFGILAAVITAIYLGIVVGIGSLVGDRGNLFLSIVATAIVAVAFQPIRVRARHFANRLVYGKRATPYEVLSTFSDHLGEAYPR